jgi:hypothetical protein
MAMPAAGPFRKRPVHAAAQKLVQLQRFWIGPMFL